jgi:hypothetical protein
MNGHLPYFIITGYSELVSYIKIFSEAMEHTTPGQL